MNLLRGIGCLATCPADGGQDEIGIIRSAALVWEEGVIRWVGPEAALPAELEVTEAIDAEGALVVPGLVDCHTHLAFGGWRADEFAARIAGVSYLEISEAGGGIASTVRATRDETEDALRERCRGFADEMLRLGVTTIECKSGYGLTTEDELKLLGVYRRLAELTPQRIVPTFLGAHVVPPEYRDDPEAYVQLMTTDMLPRIAGDGLARFCDVFVERTAFTIEQAERILAAAATLGLGRKVHADQLSAGGGAELAARSGAVSAEHLEHISASGIDALASAGVVAVSLPVATLYLGESSMPARRLIQAGVPVAVATDFNPGTAPSYHLPFALTLACVLQRMTPAEALKGATVYAARAVGLEDEIGSLEVGKRADFALLDAPDVDTWLYHLRANACRRTVIGGSVAWSA